MLLQKELIEYLSRQITKRLTPILVEAVNPGNLAAGLNAMIQEELSAEDRLNDEVRDIMEQYANFMRENNISYAEMFRKIKSQLVTQKKIVRASGRETGDGMKLSRDKITDISHKALLVIKKTPQCRIKRPENDLRLEVVKAFTEFLQQEHKLDEAARAKVRSQKREILEGSEEFELLHRRYYGEEMKKLGIEFGR